MNTHAYTTETAVRQELQNNDEGITPIILSAIEAASRYIDEETNREFRLFDYTQDGFVIRPEAVLDSGGRPPYGGLHPTPRRVMGREIYLPAPIIEVNELKHGGSVISADNYYFSFRDSGITLRMPIEVDLFEKKLLFFGKLGYEPVMDNGSPQYDRPPVGLPAAIERSATLIASAWTGEMRQEQVALDGARVEILDRRIPSEAKELLKSWKRIISL